MSHRVVTALAILLVAIFALPVLSGCQAVSPFTQAHITGSPMVFAIDKAGFIRNRDQYLNTNHVTEADVVTVSINSIFLKYLKREFEVNGNQVLVYTEVYDSPVESNPYRTVVFNERHQPDNAILGVADRVIYGPVQYKGYPLRVRIYIVELDKQDKQIAKDILQAIGNALEVAQPEMAPVIGAGVAVGRILNAFNYDDYELRMDLTLHPIVSEAGVSSEPITRAEVGVGENDRRLGWETKEGIQGNFTDMPLRNGHYLVSKAESPGRRRADEISSAKEYLAARHFEYENETKMIVSYKSGYLWFDKVEVTETGYISVDDEEGGTRPYEEKTYLVLSVRTGGKQADEAAMRKVAEQEFGAIKGLIQEDNIDELSSGIKDLGQNIAAAIKIRQVVDAQNGKAEQTPEYRNKPDFALGYVSQLICDNELGKKLIAKYGATYARSLNASLLRIIESCVLGFPLRSELDADNFAGICDIVTKAASAIKASGKDDGLFRWEEAK